MKTLESRPTTSPAIDGTMMDVPLTVTWVFEHVLRNSPSREIVSKLDDGTTFRYTYAGFGKRVAQLAVTLARAGSAGRAPGG